MELPSLPRQRETITTEESVSLKGEIGARRYRCCRGRMSKGTAPVARKPTSPLGAGSTTRAPWRRSPGPGGVSRRGGPLAAENAEPRRRLTRSETELDKARRVIAVEGSDCALLGELHGPWRETKPESALVR